MGKRTKRSATRRWVSAVAVTSVLVGTLVAGQAPAAAELPGAVMVTVESAADSRPNKVVRARCPAGTRVTGGAGELRVRGREVNGLDGRVVLTRLRPVHTNNRDRFEVAASETERGTDSNWSVRAFAFCANPLPGQQIVSAIAADDGLPRQSVKVGCPAGKRMIDGGGRISGGRGEVELAAASLEDDTELSGNFFFAVGVEDKNGFTRRWAVTTYAVCVDAFVEINRDLTIVGADAADQAVVARAECDPGTRLIGSAAELTGASDFHASLESITPTTTGFGGQDGGVETLPNGIRVTAREHTPTNDTWGLRIWAFCAGTPPERSTG